MDRDPRACSTGRSCSIPSTGRRHRFGVRWCACSLPRRLSTYRDPRAGCTDRSSCIPSIAQSHRFGVRWCGILPPRRWSMDRDPRACSTGRSLEMNPCWSILLPSTEQCHRPVRSVPRQQTPPSQGTQPLALTSRGVHKAARCVSICSLDPKVLRKARKANNNPGRGAVPSHFLAFTGWRGRRYGRSAARAQLNSAHRSVCSAVPAVQLTTPQCASNFPRSAPSMRWLPSRSP